MHVILVKLLYYAIEILWNFLIFLHVRLYNYQLRTKFLCHKNGHSWLDAELSSNVIRGCYDRVTNYKGFIFKMRIVVLFYRGEKHVYVYVHINSLLFLLVKMIFRDSYFFSAMIEDLLSFLFIQIKIVILILLSLLHISLHLLFSFITYIRVLCKFFNFLLGLFSYCDAAFSVQFVHYIYYYINL